jgi:quercetin dioxygenase-like cupin family protein
VDQVSLVRKSLLNATFDQRTFTSIDVRRITLEPNQQTGRHKHPCPVVGFVVEGTALFQVEGHSPKELSAGSAFYEPANTVILHFDNGSDTAPLTFIACYLLDGPQELIEMLPEKGN